jgi:hypothetical protein
MRKSRIRIGDGPWIPVTLAQITFETRPRSDAADAAAYAFSGLIDRHTENEWLRGIGVNPGRVIDGEVVLKELAGGASD